MSDKKSYSPFEAHKIFSLNRIATISGINNDRLYNNVKGSSISSQLSNDEKDVVKKIIIDAMNDLFNNLLDP
jgi:hypothetical protein